MEFHSNDLFDTTPAMDSFMENYGQEYTPMYFQHNLAPHHASTSQYTSVPSGAQLPTFQLPCRECPGSSFSTTSDLLHHQYDFHWHGKEPTEGQVSAFIGHSVASYSLSGLPSNNDFDENEYGRNTIQPSQLLLDNSLQAGGLATTYPEYPDLSILESGENTIQPSFDNAAQYQPTNQAADMTYEAAYTDTPFDQALNTIHNALLTVDQPRVEQNTRQKRFFCSHASCPSKGYTTKQQLAVHTANKHEDTKWPCLHEGCPAVPFSSKRNRDRHANDVHGVALKRKNASAIPPMVCPHCGTRLGARDHNRDRHIKGCRGPHHR